MEEEKGKEEEEDCDYCMYMYIYMYHDAWEFKGAITKGHNHIDPRGYSRTVAQGQTMYSRGHSPKEYIHVQLPECINFLEDHRVLPTLPPLTVQYMYVFYRQYM